MDLVNRRTVLVGMLGAAGATLAGCSESAPTSPPTSPSTTPTTSPTTTPTPTPSASVDARPRWPLTGALLKDLSAAKHPAVAVKVPDNKYEHPQVGLDKADIVFVELDGYRDASGYSSTRLVPVFHSQMPDDVAPVRSIRPVDIPLLAPMGCVIGNTGAAGWVLNYTKHYGAYLEGMLSFMATRGTGSYSINQARVRSIGGVTYYDQAVVCHPKVLARQTKKFPSGPAHTYFPYAATDAEVSTASGKSAMTVHVPWKKGDSYDMSYAFDPASGRYLRSMPWGKHILANGTRVAPHNVLVIAARQHYAKIFAGSGHDEPIHDIIDSKGRFYYIHGGKYVTGTWAKGGPNAPFRFTLTDGSPLKMAPGQTFVELPQSDAKVRITG